MGTKILIIVLILGYIWGGWKFWKGFKQTNFEQNIINRLFLSTLWLPLLIVNKSYRKNYQRALKGR
jgi:hypothetical protein